MSDSFKYGSEGGFLVHVAAWFALVSMFVVTPNGAMVERTARLVPLALLFVAGVYNSGTGIEGTKVRARNFSFVRLRTFDASEITGISLVPFIPFPFYGLYALCPQVSLKGGDSFRIMTMCVAGRIGVSATSSVTDPNLGKRLSQIVSMVDPVVLDSDIRQKIHGLRVPSSDQKPWRDR
jgi:hypothetical protein